MINHIKLKHATEIYNIAHCILDNLDKRADTSASSICTRILKHVESHNHDLFNILELTPYTKYYDVVKDAIDDWEDKPKAEKETDAYSSFKDQLTELINNHDGISLIVQHYGLETDIVSDRLVENFKEQIEKIQRWEK